MDRLQKLHQFGQRKPVSPVQSQRFVQVTGPDAMQLIRSERSFFGRKGPWRFNSNDRFWLARTDMKRHCGTGQVFYDRERNWFLVFPFRSTDVSMVEAKHTSVRPPAG